jgi:hypothetical protein
MVVSTELKADHWVSSGVRKEIASAVWPGEVDVRGCCLLLMGGQRRLGVR